MKNFRVLVLGEDTQSFLAIIRSLGRAGIEVHVAWCPMDSAALKSRFVHTVHRLPTFRADTTQWLDAFKDLLRSQRFDLVLPTTDSSALPLQLHHAELEDLARLYILPDDVYRTCASKQATWELGDRLGIPVPRQHVVENREQALEAAALFGYPLVLKPFNSARAENPGQRQKVEKAENQAHLLGLVDAMTSSQPILAQENFIGIGVGVEVLCNTGKILVAFQHERIHEPLKGGGSSYRRSVPLDADMLDASARLMKALNYTGVAMVEFKHDRASGRWILIEINARFWGSLALSIAAGLDFPLYLVQLLLEGVTNFPQSYRTGIYCRHWSRDIQWFLGNLRADKSDRTLQTRKLSSVFSELLNVVTLRERSDTFSIDDPAPAFVDLGQFLEEKLFRVLKLLKPFRILHGTRLRRLSLEAGRIIVVCHGNICRSPFAGAVLRDRFDRDAVSRGSYPKEGRTSPVNAILAAEQRGIDLSAHRSGMITLNEFQTADLVLIFDRRNWLSLRALAPELMGYVAYLGAAQPAMSLEIPDPYGGSLADFTQCYARIEDALGKLSNRSSGNL